jgi:DNA repair protein RecO (recombination protein O)
MGGWVLSCYTHHVKTERTEAIILHTFPSRERDKMVVFLTPDHGKRKGFAYGARAIRSRFGAALEPLAKVRIGYTERESEDVVRIESVDLVRSLFPAQQSLVSSVAATFIAELVDTFAPEHDPAELIYRLLDKTTEALLDGAPPLPVVAYAEVWMLKLAGIFPSIRNCMDCGTPLGRPLRFDAQREGFICDGCGSRDAFLVPNDVAGLLDDIGRLPVGTIATNPPPQEVLMELRSLAGTVRRNFLGHELKSFEVLASVMR